MLSIQTSTVLAPQLVSVPRASWHSGKCGVKRSSRSARRLVRAVESTAIAERTQQHSMPVGFLSAGRNGWFSGGENCGAFDRLDWAYNEPRNRPLGDRSFRVAQERRCSGEEHVTPNRVS